MSKYWWLVAVVVVGGVYWASQRSSLPSPLYQSASPSVSSSASPTVKTGSKATSTPTPNQLSYSVLVNQYADRRIQFDAVCHATPGQLPLKNGSMIMLDNRADDAKTVTLGNKTYNLSAYGYQVVTVNTTSTLPVNVGVDCKSQTSTVKNSAVIYLQALIGH